MPIPLDDPGRLRALARSGLLDSEPEEGLDRLTGLASRLLGAPVALVSLVDGQRQHVKSTAGIEPWQPPVSPTFCQYVVVEQAPLFVSDARLDPRVRENLEMPDLDVIAYAGVPLTTADGHTLGSLCAIESSPREWTEDDIALLGEIARGVISEIELRATNRELREAEERFHRTLEHAPIGMALVAPDGGFLEVNRSLCEIVGYSSEELLALTFQDITHPDDLETDLEYVRQMLAGEFRTYQMHKRYLHKDGRIIWIKLSVSLIREATGEPLYFVSQIEDITSAKRADEALREAQSRLQAIFDHVPAGLSLRDLDGRYIHVNNYVARALGTTTEELSGHRPAEHLGPGQIERVSADDEEMLRSGKPAAREVSVRNADGTDHDYHVVDYPVVDEHGSVAAFGSFTLDITERKGAERARERAFKELDEAQRIARIGSWSWDTSTSESVWSPEMYRAFARDPADGPANGEQFFAYLHAADRDRIAARYAEILAGAESFDVDYRIVAGDGTHRTLHALGRRDSTRQGFFMGTVQDVTELREAERDVRRERDYAAAITRSMREGLLLTREGTIIDVNDALCELTGFSRQELIGASIPYPFWAPTTVDQLQRHRLTVRAGESHEVEAEYVRKDGVRFAVSINTTSAHPADGELLGYVSTIRDITDEKRHRAELERLATSDSLTGLLNHRVFHELLAAEIARAKRHHRPLSIALLDLDHFKDINDRHGHPTGDRTLREAADRLRPLVRQGEHLARVGGEEFAWILPYATGAQAYAAVERVRTSIAASPFPDVGTVTLSGGVCTLADAGDAERLYHFADQALYQAKQQGRNRTCRHNPGSDTTAARSVT